MATGRLSKIGLENIKWWDGGDRAYSVKNYLGGVDVLNAIGDMVDVFAVTGARDQNAIGQTIARIGSSNVCLYLGYGNWNITSNLTIPSNIYIYLTAGSMFNINTGVTLTLPSPNSIISANNQQIFSGAGTVAFSDKEGIVWPGWKGAIGDGGTTDCTTALSWALGTHCEVRLPEASSYYKIIGPILDSTFSGDATLIGVGKPEIRLVLAAADDDDLESGIDADASTTNLTVKNLILRGNADGAHGYGIGINASHIGGKLIIDNVELSYWSHYGLYMWDIYADIGFVEAHHNGVQGIAITNNTKQINAGLLYSHDNGTTVGATLYGNGLDIEWSKSRAYGLRNINIETVVSTGNAKRGIQISTAATPAEIAAQGLTLDDFGNIRIGQAITDANGSGGTYSGIYIDFPQVRIDNFLSTNNTLNGLETANSKDNDSKGLSFGMGEAYGNAGAGAYLDGSSTAPWAWIKFDFLYSHDNDYGLWTPATDSPEFDYLELGYYILENNTTAEYAGGDPLYSGVKNLGYGVGIPAASRLFKHSELRAALTDDGTTNTTIRLPSGAHVTAIHIQIDTIDGGASAEYQIENGTATWAEIDVSAAGATGLRVIRPEDNYLNAADDDSANMGYWVTADNTEFVRADPIGTWATGTAVGTLVVEFNW